MNKKAAFAFICIYVFLYTLNYLHPMSFGDDYLYSFIWQGKPMSDPLSEEAVRVASWHDIFVSQWSHYFTWGGRTVAHVLAQFFLWMGKPVFNFFNALISIVLIAEIYWFSHQGKISLDFQANTICWIFFVLWAFTPGFTPVFFWLTAACNYLWTNVILLAFLLPYVQKYYMSSNRKDNYALNIFMFLFGIIAGWTNENSVCWIILILSIFVVKSKKQNEMEPWLLTGLAGLIIGYIFLMLAPGNAARLYTEQNGGSNWLNAEAFKTNLYMFLCIFYFQIFLWFFSLRGIFHLRHVPKKDFMIKKEILLVKILCILAFGMTAIMFFSPGFPPRSGFSGTIFLIIAAGTLLRIQGEYGIELILSSAKKFLFCIGLSYFVMTSLVTVYNFYNIHIYMTDIINLAKQYSRESPDKILQVKPMTKSQQNIEIMSGFHLPGFELSENENRWMNVAFSRYYGIRGVQMIKERDEKEEADTTKNMQNNSSIASQK